MTTPTKKIEDYSHTLLHIRAGVEVDRESNTSLLQVMVTPLKVKKTSSNYEKTSGRRVKFDTLLKPVFSGSDLLPEYMLHCLEDDMDKGCELVQEAIKEHAARALERATKLNVAAQGAPSVVIRKDETDISWSLKSQK